jgi:hypothetical protein
VGQPAGESGDNLARVFAVLSGLDSRVSRSTGRMKVFSGIGELEHAVGTHLGHSQWHLIDRRKIDAFAEATPGQSIRALVAGA